MTKSTSGYSKSILVKGGKTMTERWAPRSGLKHRVLMLWPPYRRADYRRAMLRSTLPASTYQNRRSAHEGEKK